MQLKQADENFTCDWFSTLGSTEIFKIPIKALRKFE